MRIRVKLALLGAFLALCICISLLVLYRIQSDTIHQLRRDERQTQQDISEDVFAYIQKPLTIFARDYGVWDAMVEHVQARDLEWIRDNVVGSLATYNADAVWVVERDGSILFSESSQGEDQVVFPLESEQLQTVPVRAAPLLFYTRESDELVRTAVSPILYNTNQERNTENFGYIVVSHRLTETDLIEYGKLLNAEVKLIRESPTPDDIAVSLLDFSGKPTGYLTLQFSTVLVDLVNREIWTLITFVICAAIVSLAIATYFHTRWISGPLQRVIATLEDCSDPEFCLHLPKREEFATLESLVDAYMEQHRSLIETKKQLTKELSQSVRFSEALKASTEPIVITDKDGRILYVNNAWSELNGYAVEEVIGKSNSIVHSDKNKPELFTKLWNTLHTGKPFATEELINRRKDGSEYPAYLSIYPIVDQNGDTFYVAIQQDITKRKEVDQMKSDFVSVASHQLRTPLSAIRWFAELLREKIGTLTLPQEKEILDQLYSSTLRMIALVNMLLDISRIESGRVRIDPEPTDLQQLVSESLTELQSRIDTKKIIFDLTIEKGLPQIAIDPGMIREVYMNLFSNAIKYTPEGGHITLTIRSERETIVSTIEDSGVGIPRSEQERIFTKFYRGSNVRSIESDGTGLGLYFVKAIVESSGGKIWFESHEGKGSTFSFTLPKEGVPEKPGTVKIGGRSV